MNVADDDKQTEKPPISPLISVVIPTRNRPLLVERAVRSALDQDICDLEVIVVIDGPDPESEAVLNRFKDERLHVLGLHENVGGSEARNIGVRYARGRWIALLDDDDEWLPGKLGAQSRAAIPVPGPYVFVGGRFIERSLSDERILPLRIPTQGERFCDYLFVRRGWHSGEGFIQTSTWFISRQLLIDVPFTPGLRRCQDLDWLLRATALPETKVVVPPEVVAIFHHDERGDRVSRSADWKFLYEWATTNRRFFSSRAFSFFIATFCVPSAAKERQGLRTFFFLLEACLRKGAPGWKCLLLFLFCWFMPEARRRTLRASADSIRRSFSGRAAVGINRPLPGKAS